MSFLQDGQTSEKFPNRSLTVQLVEATVLAAIMAYLHIGGGKADKNDADQAATTALRDALNSLAYLIRVVIGEGERDEAPMLFIGELLGKAVQAYAKRHHLKPEEVIDELVGGEILDQVIDWIDIAVDPIDNTNACAYGLPDSIVTLAFTQKGGLLRAPDTYMHKLAAKPACKGHVHINKSVAENIEAAAKALNKPVKEVRVCILKRDRHEAIMAEAYATGARVFLITDGDVLAAIRAADPNGDLDLYIGIGAAPEGVLAATAIKGLGGAFQARLHFDVELEGDVAHVADTQRQRARDFAAKMETETGTGYDIDQVLELDDLVRGPAVFIATGITDGGYIDGVRVDRAKGTFTVTSLVIGPGFRDVITTERRIEDYPELAA